MRNNTCYKGNKGKGNCNRKQITSTKSPTKRSV